MSRRLDKFADTEARENEDKPLDCWREVERFKSEVSKLEQVGLRAFYQRFPSL